MTIIKLPRLRKSDCAIFIRSSGGNNRWKDCRANRIFKTRRQLERIRHSKRDIPAHAEVFEVIAHPPGKGKRYRELVDGVTSGQIRTLIVEDVDRLTHTVFGLGVFWARRIKRFGLNLFVINYDPYHLISASLFLALVKTHEDEHQHKIPKRREKGFARSKRLPACTVNKGGILCVDHIRYCINIHPVLKLARKVARRKNMTRKEIYKEVAGILNMKGFISHNCVTWTPRNVRRILNCELYVQEFQMYLNARIVSPYKKPDVPLGWPQAVGVSHKAIYVSDVVNRRIMWLMKKYADEENCPVGP